jgi:hypothetical protein
MKLVIKKKIKPEYKNTFLVVIETMEGDADDYHSIEFEAPTEADVFKIITEFRQLEKAGSSEDYSDFDFFEGTWSDSLYYNCDSDWYDEVRDYEVFWYDELGDKYKVKVTE